MQRFSYSVLSQKSVMVICLETFRKICLFTIVLTAGLLSVGSVRAESPAADQEEEIRQATTPTAKLSLDWWKARHEAKLLDRESRPIDIVFIGDSITHGWEVEFGEAGYGLAIPEETKQYYLEGAGRVVYDEYWKDCNVLNIGFGGDETQNLLWRLDTGAVDNIKPKMLVLMIGINNIGVSHHSARATAAGIKAVLNKIREKLPETKIVLMAILPIRDKNGQERHVVNETNKIIEKFADNETIFFLNMNDKFLDENEDILVRYMPEQVHPNADGYRIWTKMLQPYYEKFVLKK